MLKKPSGLIIIGLIISSIGALLWNNGQNTLFAIRLGADLNDPLFENVTGAILGVIGFAMLMTGLYRLIVLFENYLSANTPAQVDNTPPNVY
ncbi:hypothetical protein [Boudabousia liubingyangii]|nr:hypothetical protein [Boudabousia liubingyangii]